MKAEKGTIRDRKDLVEQLLKEDLINFDEALMLMEKQKEYIYPYHTYPIYASYQFDKITCGDMSSTFTTQN